MPIHDWSRLFDGAFHAFHHSWITFIQESLNSGILPAGYYALAEQVAKRAIADVLTLRSKGRPESIEPSEPIGGATAVATAPPRVRHRERIEAEPFTRRQNSVVIRHASDDRIDRPDRDPLRGKQVEQQGIPGIRRQGREVSRAGLSSAR